MREEGGRKEGKKPNETKTHLSNQGETLIMGYEGNINSE